MAERDGWGSATSVPIKQSVSPQANKAFGKGFDDKELTDVRLSHSTAKVSGPNNPKKGSNDIAHTGTMASLKDSDIVTANRPESWPRGFQR